MKVSLGKVTLIDSVHNTDSKSFVCDHIDSVFPKSKRLIDASAIIESLNEIKLGKSAGIDSLAAEHFVYSHNSISVHLALLFTCKLNNGHVTTAFMKTSIIPILKNRNGDSSDKIIIGQLQLLQRCPNCLNCVYQNYWILSWLQVITNLVLNANMLLIYAYTQ